MAQSFAGPLAGFLPDPRAAAESRPAVAPAKRTTGLIALLRAWSRRAEEMAQLARFDAREMQDIGLTDADRAAILATPVWREAERRR